MTTYDKLLHWFKGNEAAAALMDRLFHVSQIADDFVDADKPIDKNASMGELLMLALVEIPANAFYRQNQGVIAPLLITTIKAFETSNTLRKSSDRDCAMMAWALRDSIEHLITVIAYLIAGSEWASRVSLEMTYTFRTDEDRESLDDWIKS